MIALVSEIEIKKLANGNSALSLSVSVRGNKEATDEERGAASFFGQAIKIAAEHFGELSEKAKKAKKKKTNRGKALAKKVMRSGKLKK